MTTIGDAFVRVRPDMDGFEQEAKSGIGGALASTAKVGVAALATAGAAAATFGTKAVMAASDLGESVSKVNVVFGDSAGAILEWGKSTEGTLLLSQQQALDAAGTFGNLFTSFGMGQEGAAQMSGGLVQLAQDLSSFNNIPVEEALDALRAGMTGETEPLKRLGASFSAAELEAKALSMGLVKQGDELDNNAKAQAAYALIMERTKNAQGDAARTADGLANQLKILKADAMDTVAGVGQALLPVATELVGSLGGVISQVAPLLADMAAQVAPLIGGLVKQIGPLLERLAPVITKVFGVLATVMEAIPWDMVVVAVGNIADAVAVLLPPLQAALVPILKVIGTLLPPISALFTMAAEVLAAVLMPVIEAVAPLLVRLAEVLDSQLNAAMETLWPLLVQVAEQLGGALGQAIEALIPAVMQIIDAFLPLLPVILDLVTTLLPPLMDVLVALLPVITELATIVATVLAGAIQVLVSWLTEYLVPAFQAVVLFITDHLLPIIQGIADGFRVAKEWVQEHIGAIVGFVTGLPARIARTIASLWDGLKNGITTAKDWVGDRLDDIVGFVTGLPGRLLAFVQDLVDAGLGLGKGLVDGFVDGVKAIGGFAGDVADAIVNAFKDAWNMVAGMINDFVPNSIGWGPFSLDLPDNPIPTFHSGGLVPGGPSQEMLALLQGGETVRTRSQEQALQRALEARPVQGAGGPSVVFSGPVTFGADMPTAVGELEWMTRYRMEVAA